MMQSADPRLRLDLACVGPASLDKPTGRRGLFQSDVRTVFVIIRQIFTPKPLQMTFVQRDDVIHHLPPNTADGIVNLGSKLKD